MAALDYTAEPCSLSSLELEVSAGQLPGGFGGVVDYDGPKAVVPNLFGTRAQFRERQLFPLMEGKAEGGLGMIQAHCIYCVLYSYYYTSSASDHQALDPRGSESSTLKDILVI